MTTDRGWIPGHRPDVELPDRALARPALVELLQPPTPPIAVVCAPVGFGKSVLVRQWLEQDDVAPSAWVSSGPGADGAATHAAARRALDDLGAAVGAPGAAPGPEGADGELAEWLSGMPPAVLVVDGLADQDALRGIEPLVTAITAATGGGLRLVVTTRARPTDEIARALARGSATFVSEDDLALDLEPATALVSTVAGRDVDPAQVQPLLDVVGGWAAGLAAIARGWQRATTEAAMAQRTRSSLELLDDYVVGEVVEPAPPEVRALVAELGHLPVLTPDLCDELRGRHDGAELLSAFRAGGGMVTPGEHDGWFEVHPALSGAVRRRLPGSGAATEGRNAAIDAAAAWYVAQGEPLLAVQSLADDGRWEAVRTATIEHVPTLLRRGHVPRIARLLREAPLDVFKTHLVNLTQYAFFELTSGNVNRALQLLSEMERFYSPREAMAANLVRSAAGVYQADPRPAMLAGEATLVALDGLDEEIRTSPKYYIPSSGDKYRVMLGGHLLIAGALTGEWRRVQPHRSEVPPDVVDMAPSALVGSFGNRAAHLALAGELVEAELLAERGLAASVEGDLFVEPATAVARYARGEARRAGGAWQQAVDDLVTARDLARANSRILLGAAASASLAHALLDGGDAAGATEVLADVDWAQFDRARTLAGSLASARARVRLADGDASSALALLQTARPTPMSAGECVAIALQVQDHDLAESVLEHWPVDPTVDNRVRRGLALAAHGSAVGSSTGTEGFGRAVSLAAKHGLVQPLTRLAEPLAPLLRATARTGRSNAARLCQRVLALTPPAPLPGRQLAVMQLLEEGLTLPEIADELHISASMVKKHTRAIYKALGAANRVEAVQAWTSNASPSTLA